MEGGWTLEGDEGFAHGLTHGVGVRSDVAMCVVEPERGEVVRGSEMLVIALVMCSF